MRFGPSVRCRRATAPRAHGNGNVREFQQVYRTGPRLGIGDLVVVSSHGAFQIITLFLGHVRPVLAEDPGAGHIGYPALLHSSAVTRPWLTSSRAFWMLKVAPIGMRFFDCQAGVTFVDLRFASGFGGWATGDGAVLPANLDLVPAPRPPRGMPIKHEIALAEVVVPKWFDQRIGVEPPLPRVFSVLLVWLPNLWGFEFSVRGLLCSALYLLCSALVPFQKRFHPVSRNRYQRSHSRFLKRRRPAVVGNVSRAFTGNVRLVLVFVPVMHLQISSIVVDERGLHKRHDALSASSTGNRRLGDIFHRRSTPSFWDAMQRQFTQALNSSAGSRCAFGLLRVLSWNPKPAHAALAFSNFFTFHDPTPECVYDGLVNLGIGEGLHLPLDAEALGPRAPCTGCIQRPPPSRRCSSRH